MIKLLKYVTWKEWILIVLTLLILCAQAFCNVLTPEYLGDIVSSLEMLGHGTATSLIWHDILITAIKGFAVVLGIIICTILVQYLSSIITTNLTAHIRGQVFKNVNNFSMAEINKFSIASLITRTTNDLTRFQTVFNHLLCFGITAPLTAIFAIVKILRLSPYLSIVNLISILALVLLTTFVFSLVIPKFKTIQKTTDKINLLTRENLTGIRVVRAYSAEKTQENKFEVTNKFSAKLELFVSKVFILLDVNTYAILQGTQLAIVWVVYALASTNTGLIAIITEVTQYSMQIISGFMAITMLFMMIPRGIVSANRVNEILKTTSSIKDGHYEGEPLEKRSKSKKQGSIVFDKVYFKYPSADEYVLENISFTASPGQTIAFIGSTGSGKSTLINLIPRFYDVTKGRVLVDGINVKDYKLSYLHDKLGYVPQKGFLFSGSVNENIKYGKASATAEEVKKVIDVSECKFVYDFEDGLEHFISQGGKNVSGGQKQRLSIARAIVKNPEIFIFDDSFSALDYKTDKNLRRKLKKYTHSATCLIVAQRIGTIMSADKIIVLDKGKIVGMGKHEELLKKCKVYKEIALSQLTEEEL